MAQAYERCMMQPNVLPWPKLCCSREAGAAMSWALPPILPPVRPMPTRPQTAPPPAGRPTLTRSQTAPTGRPTRLQAIPMGVRTPTGVLTTGGRPLRPEGSADRRLSGQFRRVTVLAACEYPLATSHFRSVTARTLSSMRESHLLLHDNPPLGRRHALHSTSSQPQRLAPPRGSTDHQAAAFRAARAAGWSLRTCLDDLEHTLEVQTG